MIGLRVLTQTRLTVLYLLVCACLADQLPAESLKESIHLSSTLPAQAIRVAQPFEFQLQVVSPTLVRVELADPMQKSFDDFDLINSRTVGPIPIAEKQGDSISRFRTTINMMLETARAGQRDIPAVQLQVTAGSDAVLISSDAVRVNVTGVVPDDFDPTQFRDIKPLAEIASSNAPKRMGYWLLLPIICLVAGLYFFWRRSKNSNAAIRQRWIAEIDALESDVQNRAITLPVAHDETCNLIRRWIQSSLGFSATSLPTDLLIDQLRSRSWPDLMLNRLSETLRRNDQQKFAGDNVEPAFLSSVFEDARWLIRQDVSLGEQEPRA